MDEKVLTLNFAMTSSIRIANAPCSWGVLEFDLPGHALGYAQVLDEIRDTGYAGTELGDWAFMPSDPPTLRRELDPQPVDGGRVCSCGLCRRGRPRRW
jgi:hypothetical protein